MKMQTVVRDGVVWLQAMGLGILAGGMTYQLKVIVPSVGNDVAGGLAALVANHVMPDNFWASWVAIGAGLLPYVALAANWRTPRRQWLLVSAGLMVVSTVATVAFLLPKLAIMGQLPGSRVAADPAAVVAAARDFLAIERYRLYVLLIPAFFVTMRAVSIPAQEA